MEYEKPYYGLIKAMKNKNVSQQEAADFISIGRSTFNLKINRKNGRDFKFSEAKVLSQKLNIPVSDFF